MNDLTELLFRRLGGAGVLLAAALAVYTVGAAIIRGAADATTWAQVAAAVLAIIILRSRRFRLRLLRFLAPAEPVIPKTTTFRGPYAYTRQDTQSFFGRDQDVAACASILQTTRLLILTGPSGVGKSSFINAGLTGALASKEVISVAVSDAATSIAGSASTRQRTLIIDQYEAWLSVLPRDDRRTFVRKLLQESTNDFIVIAVRSDSLDNLLNDLREMAEIPPIDIRSIYSLDAFATREAETVVLRMLSAAIPNVDAITNADWEDFAAEFVHGLTMTLGKSRAVAVPEVLPVDLQIAGLMLERNYESVFSVAALRDAGGVPGLFRAYVENAATRVWTHTSVDADTSITVLRQLITRDGVRDRKTAEHIADILGLELATTRSVLECYASLFLLRKVTGSPPTYELIHDRLVDVLSMAPSATILNVVDVDERLRFWRGRYETALATRTDSRFSSLSKTLRQPIPVTETLRLLRRTIPLADRRMLRNNLRAAVLRLASVALPCALLGFTVLLWHISNEHQWRWMITHAPVREAAEYHDNLVHPWVIALAYRGDAAAALGSAGQRPPLQQITEAAITGGYNAVGARLLAQSLAEASSVKPQTFPNETVVSNVGALHERVIRVMLQRMNDEQVQAVVRELHSVSPGVRGAFTEALARRALERNRSALAASLAKQVEIDATLAETDQDAASLFVFAMHLRNALNDISAVRSDAAAATKVISRLNKADRAFFEVLFAREFLRVDRSVALMLLDGALDSPFLFSGWRERQTVAENLTQITVTVAHSPEETQRLVNIAQTHGSPAVIASFANAFAKLQALQPLVSLSAGLTTEHGGYYSAIRTKLVLCRVALDLQRTEVAASTLAEIAKVLADARDDRVDVAPMVLSEDGMLLRNVVCSINDRISLPAARSFANIWGDKAPDVAALLVDHLVDRGHIEAARDLANTASTITQGGDMASARGCSPIFALAERTVRALRSLEDAKSAVICYQKTFESTPAWAMAFNSSPYAPLVRLADPIASASLEDEYLNLLRQEGADRAVSSVLPRLVDAVSNRDIRKGLRLAQSIREAQDRSLILSRIITNHIARIEPGLSVFFAQPAERSRFNMALGINEARRGKYWRAHRFADHCITAYERLNIYAEVLFNDARQRNSLLPPIPLLFYSNAITYSG